MDPHDAAGDTDDREHQSVALTRNASTGQLRVFVDGFELDATGLRLSGGGGLTAGCALAGVILALVLGGRAPTLKLWNGAVCQPTRLRSVQALALSSLPSWLLSTKNEYVTFGSKFQ